MVARVSLTCTVKVPSRSWLRVVIPVLDVLMMVSVVGLLVFDRRGT